MNNPGGRRDDGLPAAGWPLDDGLLDSRILAEPEVQPEHALRGIAVAARSRPGPAPGVVRPHPASRSAELRADGAAIAPSPFAARAGAACQFELDPVAGRVRPCSCRAAAGRSGWRPPRRARRGCTDRPGRRRGRRSVGDADGRGHVDEVAAAVDPDALRLVAREAAVAHGRPVLRVGDQILVARRRSWRSRTSSSRSSRRRRSRWSGRGRAGRRCSGRRTAPPSSSRRSSTPSDVGQVLVVRQAAGSSCRSAPRGCCPGRGCPASVMFVT